MGVICVESSLKIRKNWTLIQHFTITTSTNAFIVAVSCTLGDICNAIWRSVLMLKKVGSFTSKSLIFLDYLSDDYYPHQTKMWAKCRFLSVCPQSLVFFFSCQYCHLSFRDRKSHYIHSISHGDPGLVCSYCDDDKVKNLFSIRGRSLDMIRSHWGKLSWGLLNNYSRKCYYVIKRWAQIWAFLLLI